MKKAILTLLTILSLGACQMNDGDIGDYFGSWLLWSLTIDGEEDPDFDPETTFWEFQNNIVDISQVTGMFDKDSHWGTWEERDGKLLLDFRHHEEGQEPGTGMYQAPEWLYFTPNTVIELSFVERSSNEMKLSWYAPDGRRIDYSLRKIW